MGLFSSRNKTESIALIDITAGSVGAAYAHYAKGESPVIYYSTRVPVETRDNEEPLDSMLRALEEVEDQLMLTGAPTLRRETGSGHIDRILVSVGAPWQETKVSTKHIQPTHTFIVTRALLANAADDIASAAPGRIESGRSIIATILNGYEIGNPFGKRATRADIVVLSSSLDKKASDAIQKSLRRAFHAHDIQLTAFAPVSYAVIRDLYPHQKNFIILEVSDISSDAAFVKHGLLSGVKSAPHGLRELTAATERAAYLAEHEEPAGLVNKGRNLAFGDRTSIAENAWLASLRDVFSEFAALHALPHTMFLLADAGSRDFLKRTLEGSELRTLWLSDEPLSIMPLAPGNLAPYLKTRGQASPDFYLSLLALFYRKTLIEVTAKKAVAEKEG